MESLKQSMINMTEMFNKRMAEFQDNLETSSTTSGGSLSHLTAEFNLFRTFVISSISCLQSQLTLLMGMYDQQETRSRRKILLFHGVPEEDKENTASIVCGIASKYFKFQNFSDDSISRCHRMGQVKDGKPRPVLLKLCDVKVRDKIWLNKKALKGSGVTVSEFLTKSRHNAFMAARKRFGVEKCWTKDGCVFVIDSNGIKHRVVSIADVESIPDPSMDTAVPSRAPAAVTTNDDKVLGTRSRRQPKAK